MTKSPWQDPPLTGTPLDYVPISAPLTNEPDDTPERASRLWGFVYVSGALIVGVLLGQLV